MANTNAPFGFQLLGSSGGMSPVTFSMIERKISSSNSEKIYKGDPVEDLATGYIQQWNDATVAASRLVGIFNGCKYRDATGSIKYSNYWPGSAAADATAFIIPVIGSVPMEFLVQADDAALTFAEIGQNFDVVIGTGNDTTGLSGAALDSSSAATTGTLPFSMVGLWSERVPSGTDGADDTASYNRVIVRANVQQTVGI